MAFSVRQKLWFGFGSLLAIIALVTALGVALSYYLDRTVDQALVEHRQILRDYDQVGEAFVELEHYFHGDPESARSLEAVGLGARIDAQMAAAAAGPLDLRERALLEELRDVWQAFKGQWSAYTAAPDEAARQELYRSGLTPAATRVSLALDRVRRQALSHMADALLATRPALAVARNAMIGLLVGGAVITAGLVWRITRRVLGPLSQITASLEQIRRGEFGALDRQLPDSDDEFGRLGMAVRSMAAALEEYRRAEHDRLARTEQTTQLAIDSLPHAVAMLSPGGVVEIANQAAGRLFALRPGARVADLGMPWLAHLVEQITREPRRIEPRGYESAVQIFENGQERFFLPHGIPVRDPSGRLVGLTVVLADATNLRQIDEAKSSLISTVSHELKTPLTSIQMCIHLLADGAAGALSPKQRELVEAAGEDTRRLHGIIEDLLDLGRVQSGQMHLEPMPLDEIVREAAEPLEAAFTAHHLALRTELPPGLPAVLVDRPRVRHVLENLLSNAIKYTPARGVVTISAAREGRNTVRVRVSDTGVGIPPAYLGRIFEKFVRVPTPTGRPGAGLGLAIAREIVQAHGGTIDVESREGVGSTFSFTLKAAGTTA